MLKPRLSKLKHISLPVFYTFAAVVSVMTVVFLCQIPVYCAPTSQQTSLRGTWGRTTKTAYLRIRPSANVPNVAKVPKGTKMMAWGTYKGWYRVETPGHRLGWVDHTKLNVHNPEKLTELSHKKAKEACESTDDTQVLYGSATQLRLYYATYHAKGALDGLKKMGAPLKAKKQQHLDAQTQDALTRIAVKSNSNYDVETITKSRQAKTQPSRGGSPRDVIKWAKKTGRLAMASGVVNKALSYRGMPYIFGASSPRRGFDCSGLVSYVLRKKGLNPPRTASSQYHYGHHVSRKNLRPGDLVFFGNTYKHGISHVGIYIGNNKFVHAANPRKGVRVDSLSSSYYKRHYRGARRPPYKK